MTPTPPFGRGLRGNVRRLFRIPLRTPSRARADAGDELESYIESRIEHFIARGMTPAEARLEALQRLGGTMAEVRAMLNHSAERRESRMRIRDAFDDAIHDLRYAMRGLARRPTFTAAAGLCLAIGIGANAAMFGIVDALLLRPPPGVRDPGSVLWINAQRTTPFGVKEMAGLSYADYVDISGSSSIATAAAYHAGDEIFGAEAEHRPVTTLTVSSTFMPLLGVRPWLGRFFTVAEERPSTDSPIVLGYDFWRSQFAGASDVLGRTVYLGTTAYTVVGVAPPDFNGVERTRIELYVPLANALRDPSMRAGYRNNWLTVLARPRVGAGNSSVAKQLDAMYHRADGTARSRVNNTIVVASPTGTAAMHDAVEVQNATLSLWLAMVAAVVLLIACGNVASLLLARSVRRRREIAVRLALGAGRARLVKMLMAESVMLAMVGGAGGLVVARWGGAIIRRPLISDLAAGTSMLSLRVLLMTVSATLVTGVVCGLAPALQATKPDLSSSLKADDRGVSAGRGRFLNALIVGQVALSLVLLVSAGLFVRSLRNLDILDLGFDVQPLLRSRVNPAAMHYSAAESEQFFHRLLQRIGALPGVERAAVATGGPFGNVRMLPVFLPGRALETGDAPPGMAAVTTDFFTTLGMSLRRGRWFTAADREGAAPVAVVNDEMARSYWPTSDAVGQCMKIGVEGAPCTTVVGVVSAARQGNITRLSIAHERPMRGYYLPLDQVDPALKAGPFGLMLYVRSSGDAIPLVPAVRRAIHDAAPSMPGSDVTPFSTSLEPQIRPWRVGVMMFGIFGAVALVLAVVGLYGVLAFQVGERRREIAVRIALGARPRDVHRLVMGQGLRLSVVGVAIGLVLALTAGRAIAALLFGISSHDPITLATTSTSLLVVTAVASYLPARRAMRIDPTEGLRDL